MSENITNNPSVPTQVVSEVKFPRFINNLGIIPTSYKDSMDYYETLAWLCKYLEETVIPTLNQNGNAVQELQGLYIQLQDYVVHYFDNLNVQTEINNKLDKMAEDGTLTTLIGQYITPYINEINTNINSLEDQVQGLASGSPAGVYATAEALTTADPDHSKIYVVNSDGYWYYYNTTTNTWTAGGPYQASVESDVEADLINETGMVKLTPTLVNKAIRTNGNTVSNLSGENVEGFNSYVVNTSFGDVFTIYAQGNSTYRIWTFIDENGNVLTTEYSALNTTNTGIVIYAPLNASKLIINDNADKPQYKGKMNITKINENESEIENTKNALTSGIIEQKLVFEVGAIIDRIKL